jgi:hypothetical protein
MRKTFLILSIIFLVISIVFSALPLDTLALLPIGITLILLFITFKKSEVNQRQLLNWLFIITYLCGIFVLGKTFLIKDEVAVDQQFEQQKIETKQEARQELEELEGLE